MNTVAGVRAAAAACSRGASASTAFRPTFSLARALHAPDAPRLALLAVLLLPPLFPTNPPKSNAISRPFCSKWLPPPQPALSCLTLTPPLPPHPLIRACSCASNRPKPKNQRRNSPFSPRVLLLAAPPPPHLAHLPLVPNALPIADICPPSRNCASRRLVCGRQSDNRACFPRLSWLACRGRAHSWSTRSAIVHRLHVIISCPYHLIAPPLPSYPGLLPASMGRTEWAQMNSMACGLCTA